MSKHEVPNKDFGKEFSLIHEAVVAGRKVGADRDFWKLIGNNPMIYYRMVHFVKNGCEDPFTEEVTAQRCMKDNFLSLHAVSYTLDRFTEEEWKQLERIPFDKSVMEECGETHVLFPYKPMSVDQMHKEYPQFFGSDYNPDLYHGCEWAHKKSPLGWYMVRKDAHPGSVNKQRDSQIKLKGYRSSPSVAVLVYMTIAYYQLTGKWLIEDPVTSCDQDRDSFYMMVSTTDHIKRMVVKIERSPSRHSAGTDIGIASEVLPMFR